MNQTIANLKCAGRHGEYYVFDADLQKNVAGPYPVKWMAKLWIAIDNWSRQ